MRWRHVAWCALVGVAFLVLPLMVTSPDMLAMQYRSWLAVQEQDTAKVGMAWMGGIIELVLGRAIPHAPVQLFNVLVVLAGAWLSREQWENATVRRLLLSSLLIFAVVFNHMAESPSFVIAYTGLGIWWASMPRERWRDALLIVIVLLGSVGGSDLVPKDIRVAYHGKTQLKAIVTLLGWFALQYDLWRTVQQPRIAPAAVA
jgi:hypothetical protein